MISCVRRGDSSDAALLTVQKVLDYEQQCAPTPIVPDYAGANVRGIVPALLGPADWAGTLPSWMPELVDAARQVVLLVLDGLGWDQLNDASPPDADAGGAAGPVDHHRGADDHGDRPEFDRHRADARRARPDRLPDGARRRGLNVLALGGRRRASNAAPTRLRTCSASRRSWVIPFRS